MKILNSLASPFFLLLLGSDYLAAAEKIEVGVGDEVCIGGYVMDTFCIELGVLFDNPSIRTLGPDGPSSHSVHCLVDVPRCKNSPYEFLEELEDGTFGRAWRVDDNSLLLEHAYSNGVCTDCDVGNSEEGGHTVRGYRAAVMGTVKTLGDSDTPAVISVTSVSDFSALGALCEGKEYVAPSMIVEEMSEDGGRNLVRIYMIHGVLMLIGWGMLLPTGALIARFGKHFPNAWWFKLHLLFQPIGLLIALVGWIIALVNFTTLESGVGLPFSHAIAGCVTMGIAISQAINGIIRPHLPENGEEKSDARVVWEKLHRLLGWVAVMLSIVTIGTGTTLLPAKKNQRNFQIAYGIIICSIFVFIPSILLTEKQKYMDDDEKKIDDDEELAKESNKD